LCFFSIFLKIVVVSIFVKNLYCGGASWSISRLVPAPEQSSTQYTPAPYSSQNPTLSHAASTVWITPAFARLQIFTALAHLLGRLRGVSLLRCRSSINAFLKKAWQKTAGRVACCRARPVGRA
jgi:hypothetical protein